ncbi:hypothetical protein ASG54_13090 [Aureimonas sp. Leaf460]|nr:hypothetical protein ASG62_09220 [Aureimonas sp. Leaf427]KQT77268.1 hypothetical protein ASG54_13090 [Aureimonas sp. Leaf460]
MRGLNHLSSAAIDEATLWIATRAMGEIPTPIVPALRGRFGLSAAEACTALREAALIQGRAL